MASEENFLEFLIQPRINNSNLFIKITCFAQSRLEDKEGKRVTLEN